MSSTTPSGTGSDAWAFASQVTHAGVIDVGARGQALERWTALAAVEPEPVPMLLTCPACGERHVDQGEFATKPHHTHACQHCGMVWRPALVATVGVQFLPGFKDDPPL